MCNSIDNLLITMCLHCGSVLFKKSKCKYVCAIDIHLTDILNLLMVLFAIYAVRCFKRVTSVLLVGWYVTI